METVPALRDQLLRVKAQVLTFPTSARTLRGRSDETGSNQEVRNAQGYPHCPVIAAVVARRGHRAQARPKARRPPTVTLSGWSSGPDEDALLQQVVNTFEKTHPSIKVDYSVINGDYATAMTARFAAHNPPDVFYVDSSLASTWAKQGVLQPLNSYIKSSKYNTKAFYPSLLNAFKVGGRRTASRRTGRRSRWRSTPRARARRDKKAPTTWAQLQRSRRTMARRRTS